MADGIKAETFQLHAEEAQPTRRGFDSGTCMMANGGLQSLGSLDSMSEDALAPGTIVEGYEILRVLGRGGFGITYEARHPSRIRHVALKEFMPSAVGGYRSGTHVSFPPDARSLIDKTIASFGASARKLESIRHPSIVRAEGFFEANGTAYVVMELVQGRTLKALLQDRGTLTVDGLRHILQPVMAALSHVHELGFVHRDVAPDNIMTREDGGPILIDFGALSTRYDVHMSDLVNDTVGLMKNHYTAPDQIGRTARPKASSDVYSCGAVAYRALVGHPPADAMERLSAVAIGDSDPYEPMAGLAVPDVPADVAAAVDRALAMREAGRTQDIDGMLESLGWRPPARARPPGEQNATGGEKAAGTEHAPGPASVSPPPKPRNPRRSALAAMVVFSACAAVFVALDPLELWPADTITVTERAPDPTPAPTPVPDPPPPSPTPAPEPAPTPQPSPVPPAPAPEPDTVPNPSPEPAPPPPTEAEMDRQALRALLGLDSLTQASTDP